LSIRFFSVRGERAVIAARTLTDEQRPSVAAVGAPGAEDGDLGYSWPLSPWRATA
jgi:hypothetical protein